MSKNSTQKIIEAVRRAWTAGRPVVPMLGAGLSADSGIPVIKTLTRYLCKYHQYIISQSYLPGLNSSGAPNPLLRLAEHFKSHPSECVAKIGWPDRYELTQSLQLAPNVTRNLEETIRNAEKDLVQRTHPWAADKLSEIYKTINAQLDGLPEQDSLRIRVTLRQQLQENMNGTNVAYSLFCNWRRLIQHFTNYRPELADGLFHRLVSGRSPSLGHRYLAFLVRLLGVRAVLTFNFDELIERALIGEQIDFQTFAMEYGGALPYPALTRDTLTVIKMHGNNHSLLLDERLDYPLADAYKSRFIDLVGKRPLLLVAGFGTDERRVFDLLETTLTKDRSSEVCWLHFEPSLPNLLKSFARQRRWNGRVLTAATANPGLVFQHMYASLAGRHPASRLSYPAQINRPFSYNPLDLTKHDNFKQLFQESSFHVLSSSNVEDSCYEPRTASEWLIELATYGVRQGYQPLWVDLEASHTLASVVGSIIDQCRALDTQLAPSVMPLGQITDVGELAMDAAKWVAQPVVLSAVKRVAEALRRSRYLVLLDGLEAYLWPPLLHHGEVRDRAAEDTALLAQFQGFLIALKDELGEDSGSKIVISVDRSHTRTGESDVFDRGATQNHSTSSQGMTQGKELPLSISTKYEVFVKRLGICGWKEKEINSDAPMRYDLTFRAPTVEYPIVSADPSSDELLLKQDEWDRLWLTLSCVRRGRPLATLRRLLRPFVSGKKADEVVSIISRDSTGEKLGFTRLEGGGLWYHRPVRNHVYAANSRGCSTEVMSTLLALPADRVLTDTVKRTIQLASAQAILLAATHLRVSSIYYSNVFIQSRDAAAFLEYTYHRQSGIRYLAKLLALLGKSCISEETIIGIGHAGQLGRSSDAAEKNSSWIRFWDGIAPRATLLNSKFYKALCGHLDTSSIRDLIDELEQVHAQEISSLARAWVRAEPLLRVQLPAQQLVAWCNALILDVPSRYLDRVPVVIDNKMTSYPPSENPLSEKALLACARLYEVVNDFSVKMLFDRADYKLAIDTRLKQISKDECFWVNRDLCAAIRLLSDETGSNYSQGLVAIQIVKENLVQFVKNCGQTSKAPACLKHIHWLLDVGACFIKLRQEEGDESRSDAEILGVIEELLKWVESSIGEEDSDMREARMRWHYFMAESTMSHVCVFNQQIGFLGRPADQLPVSQLQRFRKDMSEAEKHVELGMAAIRAAPPRTDGRLRSLMLDPIDGGWLFLPYRSAFHTFLGRLRWLGACRNSHSSPEAISEAFRTAFECFDLARGGLDGNHQIAALNELFRVEACLARARLLLYPSDGCNVTSQLEQSFSKYETARIGLQTARKHLLTGRRNVIWWKLFYSMAAQYHADRLLNGVARLVCDPLDLSGGTVRLWEVVARLRRGYQTVRAGLDLWSTSAGRGWHWLGRAWAEMTAAAYIIGRLFIEGTPKLSSKFAAFTQDITEQDQHSAVFAALRALNRSYRLDPTETELFGNSRPDWEDRMQSYSNLYKEWKLMSKETKNLSPNSALFLRLNVLRRVLNPNESYIWSIDDLKLTYQSLQR